MPLRFDPDQRFSCRSCGRCCRRGWDIALTPGEVEAYRRADAARWYREDEDGPEGTEVDPFEPASGPASHRIRKRPDGACGFLSPENRCRIHEEMGADKKPLTCRLFPFRLHPAGGDTVVTASFSCPTVSVNDGQPLGEQQRELSTLRREWSSAQPEAARPVELVRGRPIPGVAVGTIRRTLRQMLDRTGPSAVSDLRANVARMAHWLEDLSRQRVVRLAPDRLAEYVELTGRYAAASEKPLPAQRPSALARLLFRGFLFTVAALRLRLEDGRDRGLRVGLRLRVLRLLAHLHGLWPAADGVDLAALRRVAVSFEEPRVHGLVHHSIRAAIETLGTGRRPLLDEVAVSFALLDAALALAAMHADRAGAPVVSAETLVQGLTEAADLAHVGEEGLLGRLLTPLSGGLQALTRFAEQPGD